MSPETQMDETTYWKLLNAISAARSLAELAVLEQQVHVQSPDERRANLGEVLFIQRRRPESSAAPRRADGAA
jgi:hypothetical protein